MFALLFLIAGGTGVYLLWKKKTAAAPAPGKGPGKGPGELPPGPPKGGPIPPPGGVPDGPPVHPPSPPAPAGDIPNFDLHFPGGSAYANNALYITAYQGALAYLAQAMNQPSWNPGAITGTLNAQTKSAVMAFQRANHLTADGLAGPMTANALTKVLASVVAHTGGFPVCQGQWIPIGPNLEHVPAWLRAPLLLTLPALAAHPLCPPPGSSFASNVHGVVVEFFCQAPGRVVPVSYCASLAQAGWMIPDSSGWAGPGDDRMRRKFSGSSGWAGPGDDRLRRRF